MLVEQLAEKVETFGGQIDSLNGTLVDVNKQLATGQGVMKVIETQAKMSIQTAEAATLAAQANSKALMDHITKHETTRKSTRALDRKSESWWKPILIQVLGTLATAAVLGGLYASFVMNSGQ
jgi:hypothetical protein